MKEILVCSMCGRKLTEDSVNEFDNQVMCEHCFEEQTVLCSNCGDRIWRDNAEGDSHNILCSHCYDNYYNNCERCGRLIHNDDTYYEDEDSDYPYCYECFQKIQTRPIKDYNYKPEPVFYGSGNLFYGIELEIDKGGEIDENAQILLDIANKDSERLYCKHDGSLHDGFECVSFPHTLEEHINTMPWGKILDKAIELGYRSHNTSTAGLHIHASRSAFGKSYEQQEQNVAKLVYFVEKHWNELVKFSRRTFENLNRWAAKYATISDTTEETYKKAKDKRMGRYVAVNLENYDTVEFRLFRGTLRYKTFLATLQLVDEICYCAINMTDKEIEDMSWADFVSRILPEKAELIEYLKEKRLYVNETVTESEEM